MVRPGLASRGALAHLSGSVSSWQGSPADSTKIPNAKGLADLFPIFSNLHVLFFGRGFFSALNGFFSALKVFFPPLRCSGFISALNWFFFRP